VTIFALVVIFQVAVATNKQTAEFESSLNSYLQATAQKAAADSAAALNTAIHESAAAASSVQGNFPATRLEGHEGSAAGCQGGCGAGAGAGEGDGLSVKDAVQPIEDWIKDFKTRTGGSDSGDMMKAAKMVIHPLIVKLKRSQHDALEKLEESDSEIVRRVEEQATEHVYNLLRAQHISQSKEDAAEQRKQKLEEVKAEAADKEKEAKMVAEHSHSHSQSK